MTTSMQNATPEDNKYRSADAYLVSKKDLPYYWGYILAFLEEQDKGLVDLYWPDELYLELLHNPMANVWIALDKGKLEGVMVTHFTQERESKTCYLTGINCKNFLKYRHTIAKVEQWAFQEGATGMAFEGKKPWARLMRSMGYEQPTVMLRKTLTKKWGH